MPSGLKISGVKGKNAVTLVDGVQVIGVTEGAMEPIVVHLCQNDLQAAEANQNPSKPPAPGSAQLGFSC